MTNEWVKTWIDLSDFGDRSHWSVHVYGSSEQCTREICVPLTKEDEGKIALLCMLEPGDGLDGVGICGTNQWYKLWKDEA